MGWFDEYGYLERLCSDGGPQFHEAFDAWCKENNITHELSAAFNATSNGLVEAGVKNTKFLMEKTERTGEDFARAFRAWKTSPREDGYSPASMFYGRCMKMPDLPNLKVDYEDHMNLLHDGTAAATREESKRKKCEGRQGKVLSPLSLGDIVLLWKLNEKRWS